MKTLLSAFLVLAVSFVPVQADQKKEDPPKVGALPPHPLDAVFERAMNEGQINEAILNHALYKKAVREALMAKWKQIRKDPGPKDASPEQAARVRFLEVLMAEKEKPAPGGKPPLSEKPPK